MQILTSLFLASIAAYIGGWLSGYYEGNFDLLLLVVSVVTGAYWLGERYYFLPQRRRAAEQLDSESKRRNAQLEAQGIKPDAKDMEQARAQLLEQPWWLDWTAGMFPVIVTVFLLRSFLMEPFKIPSGSMTPTLLPGDLIAVNKFEYGLRLPVWHTRLTQGNAPQRGDVMVFRFPPQPSQNYIKRVVGLPGDVIVYRNKQLSINGQVVSKAPQDIYLEEESNKYRQQFEEVLGNHTHRLLNYEGHPAGVQPSVYPKPDACNYSIEGVSCTVPPGHYFMMGDNRDNSLDSRYWGFVPEENIVGKAVFIWMNVFHPGRIGSFN